MGIQIEICSYNISVNIKYIDQYDDFIKDLEKTKKFNEYFVNKDLTNNTHTIGINEFRRFYEWNDVYTINEAIDGILEVCCKYGYKLSLTLEIISSYGKSHLHYYIVKNNKLYDLSNEINDALRNAKKNIIDLFINSE